MREDDNHASAMRSQPHLHLLVQESHARFGRAGADGTASGTTAWLIRLFPVAREMLEVLRLHHVRQKKANLRRHGAGGRNFGFGTAETTFHTGGVPGFNLRRRMGDSMGQLAPPTVTNRVA